MNGQQALLRREGVSFFFELSRTADGSEIQRRQGWTVDQSIIVYPTHTYHVVIKAFGSNHATSFDKKNFTFGKTWFHLC